MEKVIGGLSALLVLGGVWGVLALVAFLAGAIPESPAAVIETEVAVPDAGIQEPDAGTDVVTVDVGVDAAPEAILATAAGELWGRRYTACPHGLGSTLSALQVVGDPKPELVVTCGAGVSIFVVQTEGEGPKPIRIATVEPATGAEELVLGRPTAADVTGDSVPDLILPYSPAGENARASGSGLFLLPGSSAFGFEQPVEIAALASSVIRAASFDRNSGIDFVALSRLNPAAPRPLEAWVFAGSASPSRTAVLRGGRLRNTVAVLDLDGDSHLDLVFVGEDEPRLDLYFGDGGARFSRTGSLAVPGATDVAVGDLDSDGKPDLLVLGDELFVVSPGAPDTLTPRPLGVTVGSPPSVLDLDRDGDRDLVTIKDGRIVWFEQGEGLTFEERAWLSADDAVTDYAVFDFDSDSALDVVVLLSGSDSRAAGWVFASGTAETTIALGESHSPEEAPLVLRIPRE